MCIKGNKPVELSRHSLCEVYIKALRTYLEVCVEMEKLDGVHPTDEERAIIKKEQSLSALILKISSPNGSQTEFARWENEIRPCLLGRVNDAYKTSGLRSFLSKQVDEMWAKHEFRSILSIYNAWVLDRKAEIELTNELEKLLKGLDLA